MLLAVLVHAPALLAAPCTSAASGNWSAAGTWNAPCNVAGGPTAVNAVTIQNGHTVTVNAAARTAGALTINSGANATGVTLANTLTITNAQIGVDPTNTGNVIINGSTAAVTRQINVGTRTLNVTGDVTLNGGTVTANANNIAQITVTTGRANIGGNLGINGGAVQSNTRVTLTTGRIDVTGSVTLTGGGANNRDALLSVTGVPAAAGNGVNIGGDLIVGSAAGVTASANVTLGNNAAGVNSQITVTGNVTNRDTLTVGGGFFTANGATFATTAAANAPTTSVGAGKLIIAGDATVSGSTTNNTTATMSVTTGRITVSGNTTVTGGNNNSRNALLTVTGAPAVAGNGLNINGNLDLVTAGGSVTTAMTSMTGAGVRVINVGGNVNNGGEVRVDGGTFTVTGAASTYLNSSGSVVANTRVTSGTLDLSGNTATLTNAAAETLSITTTGSITVGNLATRTGVLTNAGTITISAGGTVNANGNFTNSGTFTNTAAGQLHLRGATSTVNGTFNRGTGTVTMNGGAAQSLSGTALTAPATGLHNLTIDNASGVTLGANVRTNNTITFTSGEVTTGANVLIAEGNCATSVARTSGHVIGNFQKFVPVGGSTCVFQVGSAGVYSPASLTFVGVGGAGGRLIGRVGSPVGDHPNIATSGLNAAKSVNRWWGFTTTGVTGTVLPAFTSYDATLTFVAGDVDGGAATANFEIERWNGATWSVTTVGTRTATSTQATGITALGELAIAEKTAVVTPPDSFNAVEVGAAVTGRIFTKLRSAGFTLDIVAIQGGALFGSFNGAVDADLMANAAAVSCAGGTPIGGTSQNVNLASGRGTTGAFSVATAYPNARVRIQYPAGGPYTITNCSSDNFSIKPTAFTISSADATNTGTGAGTAIKTGVNFNLTAAGGAGYAGTPGANFTGNVTGTPTAGTIGGSFGAAVSGSASGSFTYSEVGNFGLAVDAVRDTAFTNASGDPGGGDCVASSTSESLSGGRYGCWVGSSAVTQSTGVSGFGRFIPDNFNVAYTTPPIFGTACGTFTYVGSSFTYPSSAVMRVTARNGSALGNATTQNYAGSYVKLANSINSLNQPPYNSQAARYTRFDALGGGNTPALVPSGLPATTADPSIANFAPGVVDLTFSAGTGTFSFARSTTTPSAPFDADIALALNVIDEDGVAFATNPASFGAATLGGGIAFSGGKAVRYGRLRLANANGSQLVPLAMLMETQYWNGSSFITSAGDNCTSLGTASVGLGNYTANLNSGETTASIAAGNFSNGRKMLTLSPPGATNTGSVDVVLNLGTSTTIDSCLTWSPSTPAPAAGNLIHLRGQWCGATHTKDPTARARFGAFRGSEEVIHNRENF